MRPYKRVTQFPEYNMCAVCIGKGLIRVPTQFGRGFFFVTCNACGGSGHAVKVPEEIIQFETKAQDYN